MNLTGKELAAAIHTRLKETTSKPTIVFELEKGPYARHFKRTQGTAD